MFGVMAPLSVIQGVLVAFADESAGVVTAAVVGGFFLIANTVITIILTRVLSKHDIIERGEAPQGAAAGLEVHQGFGDRPDRDSHPRPHRPHYRGSGSKRKGRQRPDKQD